MTQQLFHALAALLCADAMRCVSRDIPASDRAENYCGVFEKVGVVQLGKPTVIDVFPWLGLDREVRWQFKPILVSRSLCPAS